MSNRRILLSLFVLLIVGLVGCSKSAESSTTIVSATDTPQVALSPTKIPSPTPSITPTPAEQTDEFFFSYNLVLFYGDTDWQPDANDGRLLVNTALDDCTFIVRTGGSYDPSAPKATIAGYTWLKGRTANGNGYFYTLMLDGKANGLLLLRLGSEPAMCEKAGEELLGTLRFSTKYANAGVCENAPVSRVKVGEQARLLTRTYLRNAPYWAEETRERLLDPQKDEPIFDVVDGPVCVLNPNGETANWQVRLANGEIGWLAEGDLHQYYMEPTH